MKNSNQEVKAATMYWGLWFITKEAIVTCVGWIIAIATNSLKWKNAIMLMYAPKTWIWRGANILANTPMVNIVPNIVALIAI